jgi:hypothetical protein
MYAESRIRINWATIGTATIGTVTFLALGSLQPAFGQKFARARSLPTEDSAEAAPSSEEAHSTVKSRIVRPRSTAAPRTLSSGFSYPYPKKTTSSRPFVPGWQSTSGPSGQKRGRVIRHVPGQPIDPQEGDIIYEEPDFGGAQMLSPGRKTTSVALRQAQSQFGGAEVIGPGRPTPAPGSRMLVSPEGTEGPVMEGSIVDEGMIEDGTVVDEDGQIIYEGDDGGADGGCADCSSTNYCQWGPYYGDDGGPHPTVPCDGLCIPRHIIDETSIFIGTQGFTNPVDLGRNGNFGYHEGVNFAGQFGKLLGLGALGLGYQVGATFLQSDLNGDTVLGPEAKERDQQFFTAGLFRRAHDGYGLQGGFVYDYMHDNFYAKYSVAQIRTELSYLTLFGHEFGYWGAYHIHDGHGVVGGNSVGFQTIDMYNGFYRYNFRNGTQGRLWAGGTGSKQGILGADFRLPLTNRWDLWGWYNYLIPGHNSTVGPSQQAWNMTINLVWYPGRRACGVHHTPFRALFAPADNNWLIARPSSM